MLWSVRSACLTAVLLIGAGMPPVTADTTGKSPSTTPPGMSAPVKWEYLVVSFGKTYFSDPREDSSALTSGLSKLAAFAKAGFVTANEALVTQRQLDKLGEYEWELVTVVGTIGGDQQMVFKRPFNPERSRREAALIAEEGRRLEEERRKVKPPTAKPELVELDGVDREAATTRDREAKEKRIKDAVATLTKFKVASIEWSWTASPRPHVTVKLDATADLLKNANQYRRSEGDNHAKEALAAIIQAAELTPEGFDLEKMFFLRVETVIQFDGRAHEAGSDLKLVRFK